MAHAQKASARVPLQAACLAAALIGVHVAARASYRYLANPELPHLDGGAISGAGAGLALEVGSFGANQ